MSFKLKIFSEGPSNSLSRLYINFLKEKLKTGLTILLQFIPATDVIINPPDKSIDLYLSINFTNAVSQQE